MLKKLIAIVIIICINISFIIGCSFTNSNTKINKISSNNYNFGILIDKIHEDNKEFYEASKAKLNEIGEKLGKKVEILEANSPENYERNMNELMKNNRLTFATSYKMTDAVTKIAKENADKNFVIMDDIIDLPNVKSIVFNYNEGAFLIGLIAGKMTKSNKVGFIGGVDTINNQSSEVGYIAGVKTVNEKAADELLNRKLVRYVGDANNKEKLYNVAKELYNSGADIIFHGSGISGEEIFRAAKELRKFSIGVDKDQALEFPEYEDVIITSLVKNLNKSIFNTCYEYIYGTFKGGKVNFVELGLEDQWLDIAETNHEKIPNEILVLIDKYKQQIINKEIKLPRTLDELKGYDVK